MNCLKKLLWKHAALMAGREFCYSVELVSVTPILKILGLSDEGTSWIWIASPIFGLIVGPFIGSWSDRCESKLGRRRPFLIALSIIAIIGLTLLTFAPTISQLFDSQLAGLVIAIIGSQLMDWGLDSTETPAKAYTLDCIQSQEDQASAINIQTVLVGVGGGCGYLLAGFLGMQHAKLLYVIAVTFFVISLGLTLSSFKERQYIKSRTLNPNPEPSAGGKKPRKASNKALNSKSSENNAVRSVTFQSQMKQFEVDMRANDNKSQNTKSKTSKSAQHITTFMRPVTMARGFAMTTTRLESGSGYRLNDCNSMPAGLDKDDWSDPEYDLSEDETSEDSSFEGRVDGFMSIQPRLMRDDDEDRLSATTSTPCLRDNQTDSGFTTQIINNNTDWPDLEASNALICVKSKESKIAKNKKEKLEEPSFSLKNVVGSIIHMPRELAMLCLCDLYNWILICTILIYYTDVMGEVCYKGDPMAPHNSTDFLQYETGFKMGCFGLVEYSIFMSICSGLVEKFDLFEKIGIKRIYVWSYTLLAIVCLVMFLVPTAEVILALTWILGASFAILYTIPMILLSRYHQSSHYRKQSMPGTKRNYGLDCAILISQTYLGQLFMSILVGPMISWFGSSHIIFLISSIVSLFGVFSSAFLVHYEVIQPKTTIQPK